MRRELLGRKLNVLIAAARGHTERRHGPMQQPDELDWRVVFPGPRVGIGALALAMAAAFLAGGFVVSLLAGDSVGVPPAANTIGAQNDTVAEDSRRESEITSSSGRPAVTRELLVDDFLPVPEPRTGPARDRELLVDDLLIVPAPRTEPASTREPLVDDLLEPYAPALAPH
jgi:hypothetical protein